MFSSNSFWKYLLKLSAAILVGLTTMTFFFGAIALVLAVLVGILAFASKNYEPSVLDNAKFVFGDRTSPNALLSIKVNGIILGDNDGLGNPFSAIDTGVVYGYDVKKELIDASKNEGIKGVVLEINSPGGTIYGARAIADGAAYYKKVTHKPVIAFISGLAASGGMWAAVSSDYVAADYGSTIGSIGVVSGPFKYYDKVLSEDQGILVGGVVTQNGISQINFTAGRSKDLGNPYRQFTPEEIKVMQQSVNNEYDNFVSYVSKQRKIPESTIRAQIGALIYDNKTAQDYKLIDGTLSRENAYELLAQKVGIKNGDYKIVRVEKLPGIVQSLLQGRLSAAPAKASLTLCSPGKAVLAFYGSFEEVCK